MTYKRDITFTNNVLFLDGFPSNVKVVPCSIFGEIKRNYYSLTPASKYYDFNLDIYMMLGMPIPS